MITCSSCGKRHAENTLFCDECAAYLQANEHRRTNPLAVQEVEWAESDPSATHVLNGRGTQSRAIRLSIIDTGREIEFPLTGEITLGRLDAATATFPDIDLAPAKGLEKGVSRRHAKIVRRGRELYLEDLGSVNGTYLNGRRLTPYLPHALSNHDEIRLSRVLMRVQLD